jgi:hypothetical protein
LDHGAPAFQAGSLHQPAVLDGDHHGEDEDGGDEYASHALLIGICAVCLNR